jgi:heptaprenyl diphosphate synthase
MQQDLAVRGMQIMLFAALTALTGRRVRLAQFLVMGAGIVLFNLLIPTGKVLAAPFGLPLTEGALKIGLWKTTAMIGLIVLSQFSMRFDLRLPGWIGGMIGRSLFYFELIMSKRRRIDRKDIIASIDRILIEVQAEGRHREAGARDPGRSTFKGILLLGALVCVNWAALAYTLAYPRPFWGV